MSAAAVQLRVPAFVQPSEQRTARAFTAAHGLPYRPRQILDPGQIARVLSLADARERRGLPRYGVRSPIRHDPIPEGAYAALGAGWFSREHFLEVVLPLVAVEHPEVFKGRCSVETFLRWARVEAAYAQNHHAGRDIIVRRSTVAELLRCHPRTIQRCRAVGRDLGVYVDVVKGRMLTQAERWTAQHVHSSPQRGLSNVSCMVVPAGYAARLLAPTPKPLVDYVAPSRGGESAHKSSLATLNLGRTARSAGKVNGAASPPAPTKQVRRKPRRQALAGLGLATELVGMLRWLSKCSPRRIEGMLRPFAMQADAWTGGDLVEEVEQIDRRLGHSAPTQPRCAPWGLLRYYLRQINPETASGRQRRARSRPWCGTCAADGYRWIEVGLERRPARCPRCGPTAPRLRLVTYPARPVPRDPSTRYSGAWT